MLAISLQCIDAKMQALITQARPTCIFSPNLPSAIGDPNLGWISVFQASQRVNGWFTVPAHKKISWKSIWLSHLFDTPPRCHHWQKNTWFPCNPLALQAFASTSQTHPKSLLPGNRQRRRRRQTALSWKVGGWQVQTMVLLLNLRD